MAHIALDGGVFLMSEAYGIGPLSLVVACPQKRNGSNRRAAETDGARYPWGDELLGPGRWQVNIPQGRFPCDNTGDDGVATAPVRSFEPNEFGLWQTVSNVWEWCSDWFDPNYCRQSPRHARRGPDHGHGRVIRGGSYLGHDAYRHRYRNAARSSNTPGSSAGNTGVRTVRAGGDG